MGKSKITDKDNLYKTAFILIFFGVIAVVVFVLEMLSPDEASIAVKTLVVSFVLAVIFFYFYERDNQRLIDKIRKEKDIEIKRMQDRFIKSSHEMMNDIKELENTNLELRKKIKELLV